jgi:coniferyl-aldehyde dehydrogenase
MVTRTPSRSAQSKAFQQQREAFASEPYPTLAVRLSRLERLAQMTEDHEAAIVQAIDADFGGRSSHETRLAELFLVQSSIKHARSNLKRWMRERKIDTDLHFQPGTNRLMAQPLGVVGVVSPWNYPYQLALAPTVAALAAGNRVMIKPSELTPRTSALLATLVARYFEPHEVTVVQGDAQIGKDFVNLPFDHLFFTGSTAVGREVAQAAARNLTPVTLELGGKSPAIIDQSANWQAAAKSLAFGKLLNAGQTCIAPDYVIVPRGQSARLVRLVEQSIHRMYPHLANNPDYTAIISPRHRARLAEMLAEAKAAGANVIEVNPGEERVNAKSRKCLPTLVTGAPAGCRLLTEEIFGPVLPIIEVDSVDQAIAHVNAGAKPLALYWFGEDTQVQERILRETISGGVTINDTLWHLAQESQPFGGVGTSGIGSYHGEWGFQTFSKLKPVFEQHSVNAKALTLFHPPYGKTFETLLKGLKLLHAST